MKLDFLIFGNGRGLAQPGKSGAFYWLVDARGHGAFYHLSGWFGAQLSSFQWTHPNAGERRIFDALGGATFRPSHSTRRWGRVRVSWQLVSLSSNLNAANKQVRELQDAIRGIS